MISELHRRITDHEISVRELLEQSLKQINERDGDIHAFLSVYDTDALYKRADRLQQLIDDGAYGQCLLAGIPIAIKDNICTSDLPTTCGSDMLKDYTPPYDATVVECLRDAGAIIIGKTNMDEFAFGSTTETSAFFPTKNPLDTSRVPGGSSGGSAAAVASGMVNIALGSDTGGSIRQPAAYCGLTSLKPTYGMVSRYGLVAYASSMDQIAPIAGCISDCAILLDTIGGADPKDPTCLPGERKRLSNTDTTGVESMTVGVYTDGADDRIAALVREVADIFREHGASVEEFVPEHIKYMVPAYYVIACAEGSSNLERYDGVRYGHRSQDYTSVQEMIQNSRNEAFGDELKRRILLGTYVLSSGFYDEYYLQALKVRRLIQQSYDKAFEHFDLILIPTTASIAPKLGESLSDPIKMYQGDIYTVAANLTGCPAAAFPCGHISSLPVGAQLMAARFGEDKLIRAISVLERVTIHNNKQEQNQNERRL